MVGMKQSFYSQECYLEVNVNAVKCTYPPWNLDSGKATLHRTFTPLVYPFKYISILLDHLTPHFVLNGEFEDSGGANVPYPNPLLSESRKKMRDGGE